MRAGQYRIRVRGRLSERLASAFEGLTIEPREGSTALVGCIADQAHLYGVLERIRDLGLELVGLEEAPVTSEASQGEGESSGGPLRVRPCEAADSSSA